MDIIKHINEINPEALLIDGFDKAIIGTCERINLGPVVAYDVEKILYILCKQDGMEYDEALEYFNFNIQGAWMGEYTPIFVEVYDGDWEVDLSDYEEHDGEEIEEEALKTSDTVTIEKEKLQQLINHFYETCGLCEELNIYESDELDNSMQKMKSWVNENLVLKP